MGQWQGGTCGWALWQQHGRVLVHSGVGQATGTPARWAGRELGGFGDRFRESKDRDEGCPEHAESTREGPGLTSWYGQGAELLKEAGLASFPVPDLKALRSPAEKDLHQLSLLSAFF